jgi:hypothetical protein
LFRFDQQLYLFFGEAIVLHQADKTPTSKQSADNFLIKQAEDKYSSGAAAPSSLRAK